MLAAPRLLRQNLRQNLPTESNPFYKDVPAAVGPAVRDRLAKLALYRECIMLSKAQKTPQLRKLCLKETQDEFRRLKGEGGPPLAIAIAHGLDRIEYIRMCTSKARMRELRVPNASTTFDWGITDVKQTELTRAKVSKRHEKQSPTEKAATHGKGYRDFVPMTNWGKGCLDPDHMRTHRELLDRQYFMGPHWRGKPKPLIYGDLSMEEQTIARLTKPADLKEKIKKEF